MKHLHTIRNWTVICLLALWFAPSGFAQSLGKPDHADIPYGPHQRDVLDVWLAQGESPRPALIVVHAGGFAVGDKRMGLRGIDGPELLRQGVTIVSINHPFKTQLPWPDVFHHAARSIQHLRYHAQKYNLDKDKIAIAGASSGGGIAAWLAFHDDLRDPHAKDPVLRESTKPVCAVSISSQASYDQLRWPEILEIEKAVVERVRGPRDLAAALFIDEQELFEKQGIRMRAEIDMLSMIDRNDPPVFVQNLGRNVVPGDVIHHPRHAIALKTKCDEQGVECELQLRGAAGSRSSGYTEFLLKHLQTAGEADAQATIVDLPSNFDKARKRNIPVTFHLPNRQDAQPLVLVSHGGGGSRNGMYALAAETARQGYVVMCLEHVTSNTTDLRRRMRTKGLGFRDALRDCGDDMTARKNRPLDVRFAIDLADQLNREDARFQGRIDLSQIAIVGHSYGAYTAMVCCGVKPVELDDDLGEPRIKLGIGLSPQSSNGKFFDENSFATVTRPFVGISGTRDLSGDGHRDFFKLMPPGDKHLLWFHDANHFSFSDSTGGPRTLLRPDTDVTEALKVIVPRILDSYLRDEPPLDQATRKQLVDRSLGGKVRRIEWQVN